MPKGGLACRWSTTDAPVPVLRHSQHCNHLFIAYNVVYGTLDDMGQDGNNHWVLLAVDMTRAKVHIFGVDSQLLEPGKLVALNVSTFINNCRGRRNDTLMNWSDPSFYPLYEHGLRPDTFNCGMAVISRAVSFLYPAWALNASGLADPVRLATRLSEWRCFCLCLFLDRYRVIHTENNLLIDELLSTNLPRKKTAISRPYEGREAQVFEMSQSLFLNYTIQGPAYLSLRDIHRWKSCILACAAANGFDENRVLEAFENAPDKPIEDVLRTLQCMCEVASSNILIQLKSALSYNQTNQVPHNSASTSADVEELSKLHIYINNCSTAVPFLSRFEALRGWISYSKCFDAAVASRAKNMKIERSVRREDKRLAEKQKRIYNLRQKATVGGDPPRNKADHLVRRSLVNSLVQKGFDAEEAHLQIKDHLKYSKKLRLLLNDRHTCWLLLMPLQAPQQDMFHEKKLKPTLGLMDFKPPKRIKRLEKPISSNDLLQVNEELAHYFGRHLFTARPELRRLNTHVANIFRQAEVHPLCQKIDSSIIASRPKNVVELFESTTA
ncbi:hypothetical protein B0J12DRAFT_730347 [Macrophomina phaseolina]|uniref:Ubiquitin-like protease family profile domain-containing protein n=1 Tax=Macrophomina phaseolina TaxID=35725 RepID=A0ABQ8G4L1_9PEZI|nr:hypothetical protein B0J12DRAFT_730347 [Macrophomina phaseolina]